MAAGFGGDCAADLDVLSHSAEDDDRDAADAAPKVVG